MTTVMPGGEDLVERGAVLAVSISGQETVPAGLLVEVHDEVAGRLDDPGVIRMRGGPEQVDAAGGHLHHHQHVQTSQQNRVDVEEIDRRQAVRLSAQKRSPAGVYGSWCRTELPGGEDASNRARTDVVAKL